MGKAVLDQSLVAVGSPVVVAHNLAEDNPVAAAVGTPAAVGGIPAAVGGTPAAAAVGGSPAAAVVGGSPLAPGEDSWLAGKPAGPGLVAGKQQLLGRHQGLWLH